MMRGCDRLLQLRKKDLFTCLQKKLRYDAGDLINCPTQALITTVTLIDGCTYNSERDSFFLAAIE